MRDLTLSLYRNLLLSFQKEGYNFITACLFSSEDKLLMLRHDVDSWPKNALQMAKIENKLGIKAIYYFRVKRISLNLTILRQIKELGHEIGYHYEDLCDLSGDIDLAYQRFIKNLRFLRKYAKIETIAMHGRPLSKWDSKDIWNKYSYKELGIQFEPYLDIDYSKVAYLTDTAGCWDGEKYSVRDNVKSIFNISASTTYELLELLAKGEIPNKLLINVHPARWNDNLFKWMIRKYLLTLPKLKIKEFIKKVRNKK
jgi:hypothetical protein